MPPLTDDPATPAAGPGARAARRRTARERGQVLVIFAGAMIALVALCAVVVDVAWYWTSNLRMQRAADAAALAGVVWLPGNQGQAVDRGPRRGGQERLHRTASTASSVTPVFDPTNPRRLKVAISGPGRHAVRAGRRHQLLARRPRRRRPTTSCPCRWAAPRTTTASASTRAWCRTRRPPPATRRAAPPSWDARAPGASRPPRRPAASGRRRAARSRPSVNSNNNVYATENTNGEKQQFSTFGLLSGGSAIPTPGTGQALTIAGHRGPAHGRVRVRELQQLDDRRPAVVGRRHDAGRRPSRPPNLGHEHLDGDYVLGSNSTTSAGAPTPGAGTTSATRTSGSA